MDCYRPHNKLRLGYEFREYQGVILLNLLLAVAILFFIIMFAGGIIVDQYPCWIGVPNCD